MHSMSNTMAQAASIKRPFQLGLTGGIGSGKSTVAQRLAERGATLIDADQISRSLTAPGGAALAAIAQRFGAELIAADGGLDRAAMRERVFAEPTLRQQLEAIMHPLISAESARQVQAATQAQAALIVHDIPLLVESGRWRKLLDGVLVVDCRESTQIERVMARNGLAREAIVSIMAAQASRAQRLSAADWVIYNDEGLSIAGLHAFTDQIANCFSL